MPNTTIRHKFQPINGQPSGLKIPKKRSSPKPLHLIIGLIIAIIVGLAVGSTIWFSVQLSPVGSDAGQLKKITITAGSTSNQISQELEDQGVIRSATAFNLYIRLSSSNNLKAGTYRLSPAETVQQIVQHLTNGSVDTFSITFYPGATLVDNTDKDASKKYDVTTVLRNAGYSDEEIAAGLNADYSGPLFAGKPASADLEGYIFGETYNFDIGATVSDILQRAFDQFYAEIQENNLVAGFTSQGLDLYEGITLASIIQREISAPIGTEPTTDQKQAAQVFLSRLSIGMNLGSDVTYQYAADKMGVERSVSLDSPYNTRIHTGLTPGPISVPSISALKAVASPADTDYLYFLSDADGNMYFARTEAEHQANIVNHCQENCATQ